MSQKAIRISHHIADLAVARDNSMTSHDIPKNIYILYSQCSSIYSIEHLTRDNFTLLIERLSYAIKMVNKSRSSVLHRLHHFVFNHGEKQWSIFIRNTPQNSTLIHLHSEIGSQYKNG